MSVPTASQHPTPLLSLAGFRRFTPEQYHKLIDAGVLMEGEPIELLEGYLVEKAVRSPPHDGAITRLTNRLPRRVPVGWVTRVQCATAMSDSQPEPDGAIVRGDDTSYDSRLPAPADIGVILEVSASSLAFDRGDKGRIYAGHGIPIYWILNVIDRQIEVYTGPDATASPPAYATRTDYRPGQDVPIVLDGVTVGFIPAADLLP